MHRRNNTIRQSPSPNARPTRAASTANGTGTGTVRGEQHGHVYGCVANKVRGEQHARHTCEACGRIFHDVRWREMDHRPVVMNPWVARRPAFANACFCLSVCWCGGWWVVGGEGVVVVEMVVGW